MEKEEKVALYDTIDYNQMLTNLSIGTSYILALEKLMMNLIMKLPNPDDTPKIFKKFEDYILDQTEFDPNSWTEMEMHLFTIFSLQQMFKGKAIQMGFSTKNKATLDQSLVDKLITATLKNNTDELAIINKEIEESIKEQQSS